MSFVDDNTAPGDLPQLRAVGQDHLKGGDQGVKLVRSGDQVILRRQEKWSLHACLDAVESTVYGHRSSTHLLVLAVHLVLLDHLPTGQAAVVDDGVHVGPGGELPLPVCDGGEGSDHEERALDTSSVDLGEQCDGLDGLPQTHLICQDTVLPGKKKKKNTR